MNSPLKNKIKKFSKYEEECIEKISILSKPQSLNKYNYAFLSRLLSAQKFQEPPAYLNYKQYLNIPFDNIKQKVLIIKENNLLNNLVKGSIFVVMINTNILMTINLILNWDGFEKKKSFQITKSKAIPLRQYKNGDVKIILHVKKSSPLANARINIDTIKVQFQHKKIINTISPKKQKQSIDEFIQNNRGRSAQIIHQRSMVRLATSRQRKLRTTSSFTSLQQTYRPITTSHSKRDISQFHQFESQKNKYIKHMRKMCPQKQILLKRSQSEYVQRKQQQLRNLTSWILLNKFICNSRMKVINFINERLKRVKIQMLVARYCTIMKSKLRFKITQKARYRMAVKQPLAFLGDVFYKIQLPRAQNKLLECLKKVQIYKTGLITCNKSRIYYQKTIQIQRYFRKKLQSFSQRIDIILEKLQHQHNLTKLTKQKRQQIKKNYLKICKQEFKGNWVIGLHQKRDKLEQQLLKITHQTIHKK